MTVLASRPHRLWHTFVTEFASATIDVLVLRELMGHTHAETTTAYAPGTETLMPAAWVERAWHQQRLTPCRHWLTSSGCPFRPLARRSASAPVGVTTRKGWRREVSASPAMTRARAGGATAASVPPRPTLARVARGW